MSSPLFYDLRNIETLQPFKSLSRDLREELKIVALVLPFRVNSYVVEQLIDWKRVPDDPIFQLTFLQRQMLSPAQFQKLRDDVTGDRPSLPETIRNIRAELNPHPSKQLSKNVPYLNGKPVPGIQHKYEDTCLVFPAAGQTCFSYCTFCFRWAQFVGDKDLKFATDSESQYLHYLQRNKNITNVLITGGDPMIMKPSVLAKYIDPILKPGFEHIQTIRIGSKVLSFWPAKLAAGPDRDEFLKLFERVIRSGRNLAFMAHFNHPVELESDDVKTAISSILRTGAQIRTQSPLLDKINNDARIWSRLWNEQTRMGLIPYYMFIERDTGPRHYFEVSLADAHSIYRNALNETSGLARTVRGPSMSADPGKIVVEDILTIGSEKVFALSFLRAREKSWTNKLFFAKFDPNAVWIDDLRPPKGETHFFFEDTGSLRRRATG